jgi:hypothetical protein
MATFNCSTLSTSTRIRVTYIKGLRAILALVSSITCADVVHRSEVIGVSTVPIASHYITAGSKITTYGAADMAKPWIVGKFAVKCCLPARITLAACRII